MELSLTLTVSLLIVSGLLTFLFGYMGQRPMNPAKGPRMVPWRFMMMMMFMVCIVLIVHTLNLIGFKTGQQVRY
jgi:hypothetical protein